MIKVTSFRLSESLAFDQSQMRDIGNAAADAQLQRIGQGINAEDQVAKPLDPRYATQKRNRGAVPIRDMRLTGNTLASFGVTDSNENSATVAFADPRSQQRAEILQEIEPMIGLSERDSAAPIAKAQEHFSENVRTITAK